MGKFTTSLQIERIEDTSRDGRGTWRLLAPLVFEPAKHHVSTTGMMEARFTVPAGFVTDLASVPRVPFVYLLAGGTGHAAAVLHDFLYTLHVTERAEADALFREALQACGVPAWRAWLMWAGVRAGGASSWSAPGPQQPEGLLP